MYLLHVLQISLDMRQSQNLQKVPYDNVCRRATTAGLSLSTYSPGGASAN